MQFWFRLPLRTRLGIISSALLVSVLVVLFFWYQDPVRFSPDRLAWLIHLGPLVFLFWLAWGDIEKIPMWNWLLILVTALVCAVKPPAWFIGIPIILYILFTGRKKVNK